MSLRASRLRSFRRASVLVFLLGGACESRRTTGPEPEPITAPTAFVSPTRATFAFPVASQAEWEWNLGEADGILEYRWEVFVPGTAGPDYAFGFSRFRFSAELQQGSLAELLEAGQATLWERDEDGLGARVIAGEVYTRVVSGGILIELRDQVLIERIFGAVPPIVTFEVVQPGQAEQRTRVAVEYRGL